MKTLSTEITDGVLRITFDRPEKRNAFDETMIEELIGIFSSIPDDVCCVLMRGNGKVFSAGADLGWMKRMGEATFQENYQGSLRMAHMFELIDTAPVPVVSRVHGAAIGGGIGLVAVSDIVVAMEDTRFGWTEVRLGLVPAVISTFAVRKVGYSNARRYFLTGEIFDGKVAKEMGLVHELASTMEELDDKVEEIISTLRSNGREALRLTKELLIRLRTIADGELLSYSAEVISRARATEEARERLRQFLEKSKKK